MLMITVLLMMHTVSPAEVVKTTRPVTEQEAAEARTLTQRLEEIREMSKENLSFSEKKELRHEVKSIKQRLHDLGSGVYLSVGAIIIILLLLILLL